MKKVLIVGNIWPYHRGAGARIPGLAKYLPEFGWQPVILTTPIGESPNSRLESFNDFKNSTRVIETYQYNSVEDIGARVKKRLNLNSKISYYYAEPFLRFLYKFYLDIFQYPDKHIGWKPFAVRTGSEILQGENFNALISTCPPVTSHLITKELKIKYKIPWIADFPHLWSQDHSYQYGPLRRLIDRRLEIKTLSLADALVTISEPHAVKLKTLHKGKPTYCITHGFDPLEMNITPHSLTAKFTITYTGSLHHRLRNPSKLLQALQSLISKGIVEPNDVEVRFYGQHEGWMDKEIGQYGLSGVVKQYRTVPMQVAWEKQRESQLLLIPKWEDPQWTGMYSMKVYEYLAARRPILAVGGRYDVVDELLDETKAGICATSLIDIENTLVELYREYKLKGEIPYHGNLEIINKYSHREMARKFSEVLNTLVRDA